MDQRHDRVDAPAHHIYTLNQQTHACGLVMRARLHQARSPAVSPSCRKRVRPCGSSSCT